MKPFFSIVIPTLNEETYLPKLLDSLLCQTSKNFEVIVSDAKSDDNTFELAFSYIKKFKKHGIDMRVLSKNERNVSYQRNYGAKLAKGEYFVFFDADNVVESSYIKELYKYIKGHGNCYFLTTKISVLDKNIYGKIVTIYINTIVRIGKKIKMPFAPGYNTIIFRDAFVKLGGFDPEVTILEDYDISLRAQKAGYELYFAPNARIIFSMRRFKKYGLRALFSYIKVILYSIVFGPPRKKVVDYPMGGNAHV